MKLKYVAATFFLLATTTSWSALPPKYLSVPDWQSCASEIKPAGNTASFVCLPHDKPDACPPESWRKLKRHHMIPKCGR